MNESELKFRSIYERNRRKFEHIQWQWDKKLSTHIFHGRFRSNSITVRKKLTIGKSATVVCLVFSMKDDPYFLTLKTSRVLTLKARFFSPRQIY